MYKFIGVLTMLQREVAEVKEKAEQLALDGYSYDEADQLVDEISDLLCEYNSIVLKSYPSREDEAGE